MTRIAVFIDGGMFTDAVRGQGMSMDMNLRALVADLVPAGDITGIYFITPECPAAIYPAKHRNEKQRFEKFAAQGIEVLQTQPQIIGSIFVDRGVESLMTARLVGGAYADAFDTALIVSRRAELKFAMDEVRRAGKEVKIAYFSFQTFPAANPLFDLDEAPIVLTHDMVVKQRISGARPPLF